jgi:uncharacterized membrane protein (UPF0127 family)
MLMALIIWTVSGLSLDGGGQPQLPLSPLAIETAGGQKVRFTVELADTDPARNAGLMFRKSVPQGWGMLFDFKTEQPGLAFWMKNTLVSLDILFIKGDGRILRIAERTTPFSQDQIPAGGPARAVLELAAGESRRLGIKPGDRVRHAIFGDRVKAR